jgi:hypothetical protein
VGEVAAGALLVVDGTDAVVEGAPVPVPVVEPVAAGVVMVTPTASHRARAAAVACSKSSGFVHEVRMHAVVESMKGWFLQRQALSVAPQSPVSALAMQVRAHAGGTACALTRAMAARAARMNCMLKEG